MRISQYNPPSFISGLNEPKVVSLRLRGVCGFLLHRFLKSFPNLCKLLVFTASSFCRVSNTSVHSRDLETHNFFKNKNFCISQKENYHIFSVIAYILAGIPRVPVLFLGLRTTG